MKPPQRQYPHLKVGLVWIDEEGKLARRIAKVLESMGAPLRHGSWEEIAEFIGEGVHRLIFVFESLAAVEYALSPYFTLPPTEELEVAVLVDKRGALSALTLPLESSLAKALPAQSTLHMLHAGNSPADLAAEILARFDGNEYLSINRDDLILAYQSVLRHELPYTALSSLALNPADLRGRSKSDEGPMPPPLWLAWASQKIGIDPPTPDTKR